MSAKTTRLRRPKSVVGQSRRLSNVRHVGFTPDNRHIAAPEQTDTSAQKQSFRRISVGSEAHPQASQTQLY